MIYARIQNGLVAEIVSLPDGENIAKFYHPSLTFVQANGSVAVGMSYDNGQFTAVSRAVDPAELARVIKLECSRRIEARMSQKAQINITAYGASLAALAATGTTLSANQRADIQTMFAIQSWANRPNGMLGACDRLSAAQDLAYADDSKWVAWDPSWDAFVAQF